LGDSGKATGQQCEQRYTQEYLALLQDHGALSDGLLDWGEPGKDITQIRTKQANPWDCSS
jgi:hypothetical protein